MFEPIDSAYLDSSLVWSEADELRVYRTMLLIRRLEEKAAQLFAMGHLADLACLSIGQEAVAAGLVMSASPSDTIISGPRKHGLMLARGETAMHLMSHLFGLRDKTPGLVQSALDGPFVISDIQSQAPGAAVIWCVDEHEYDDLRDTIERASLDRLPIVFILCSSVENPPGLGPCREQASALFQRCQQAGMNAAIVNGLDVRHVKAAADDALRRARAGMGVSVLEVMTYSYRGHALLSGAVSRPERARDETCPVAKARARIVASGGARVETLVKDIEHSVRAEIGAAVEAARMTASSAA